MPNGYSGAGQVSRTSRAIPRLVARHLVPARTVGGPEAGAIHAQGALRGGLPIFTVNLIRARTLPVESVVMQVGDAWQCRRSVSRDFAANSPEAIIKSRTN